jgi:hypothetical protein
VPGLLRNRWTARVAVVLLVGVLAFEVSDLTRDRGLPQASANEVGLVRGFAVAVTSFDHKRLDADIARVLALGTPGFEREFRGAMGPDFTGRIATNKTVSVGDIIAGPRLQRTSAGKSTFVVVLDQTVTSDGSQAQPQIVRVGLLVTVLDQGPKVDGVKVL